MNKTFTFGAVTGITALAVAFPVIAQISSAQTTSSASSTTRSAAMARVRTPLTQAQVQTRIDQDAAFLANVDAAVTVQKSATQAHKDALTAAVSMTDDTQRQAAVKAADEAMHTALQSAMTANPSLEAGMHFGFGKGGHHGRGGPGKGDLAAKLGMTEAELKAALDSGKTIQQIATEKGVTLPTPPQGGRFMFRGGADQPAAQ